MGNEFDNFKHYSSLTGVGVQLIALDGTPIYETEPYIAYRQTLSWLDRIVEGGLEAQTQASVISGAMQSYRFGGRFFFYSPIGLFHFASPIITNGRHTVTAVGGPVLMMPLEEYIPFDLEGKIAGDIDRNELEQRLAVIPIVSPDTANTLSEQLLVNVKLLSDNGYLGIEDPDNSYNEYLLAYFSGMPSYEAILQLAAQQKKENAAKKHERIIAAVKEYVERNYAKKITLEDVAGSVYISPSYLSKLIKIQTRHSFRHLVNMTRIAEAVRLLEFTDKNLSEIAYQTGYEDHSYFTKVFKRHTNINPSDYRKSFKASL
jgi:AraC-like DNA-binding protein/ligand-binding sensor protein